MEGPIRRFLIDDHRRLEALLAKACERSPVDLELYEEFREGLLRHIAIEEKVLVPAAEREKRERLPLAGRLRLEHGAIASLLVPKPTPAIIETLRNVLTAHNPLEEDPGGLYDLCEEWIGDRAAEVLERCRAQPKVPLAPLGESPRVLEATRRALARAGFALIEDPPATG